MNEQILELDQVIVDNDLNPRQGALDQDVVLDYSAHVDDLPPMAAYDVQGFYFLVGGFHRYAAHRLAQRSTGRFLVHQGSREEAKEYADLDNLRNGKSLTRAEKRAIIKRMIKRHPNWSSNRLSMACLTSDKTVTDCREELEAEGQIDRLRELIGADGAERPRHPDLSDLHQKRRHTKLVERLTPCECCRHPLSTRAHLLEVAKWGENKFSVQLCRNCHELYDLIAVVFERTNASGVHSVKLLGAVTEIWGPKHPTVLHLTDLAQKVYAVKQSLNSSNPAVVGLVANGGAK